MSERLAETERRLVAGLSPDTEALRLAIKLRELAAELVERVAIAIAEDDWEPAFESRAMQRICEGADGKYRDVNQPSKDEYRDMARRAVAAIHFRYPNTPPELGADDETK